MWSAHASWRAGRLRCVRLFTFPPVIDSVTVPFPPDAAGTIADAYGSAVRGYFHRALGRRDLAEDLTQEVFVRVVRSADRYDARGRDRAWVFTIAHHVLLDHFRQRAAQLEEPGDVIERLVPATQELRASIEQALLRLPEDDRNVFLLAELAGLSYAEIAVTCNTTHAAVRSRVYRARLALRAALTPPPRVPDP